MKRPPFVAGVVVAALLAVLSDGGAAAAPPSALQAKRAQAQSVEAQVNALDVEFGKVVDEWDGARIELAAAKKQLAANGLRLARARRESRIADRRRARRLVEIYETGRPDVVQLLAGAGSLSELIDVAQYSRDVAASDRQVANEARRAKSRLAAADEALREAERARRASVTTLDAERTRINGLLGKRRTLLASIQSQVAVLKARELAEQRRLAAAARARVAREQAALRARAAARAHAAAALAASARRAAPAPTAATTHSSPPAAPVPTTPTTTAALPVAPAAPVAPIVPPAAAGGHPEAASIALEYLGVPYQWGGASPSSGFDCSGLVVYVYAQLGVQLPHYAAAQYGYGTPVAAGQLQAGDLVFFDGLSHVGIYIGNGEIVHAPETGDVVKITPLSQFGAGYVGARRI
jgi:peptidoglycan DL-endopeptidase CwlO